VSDGGRDAGVTFSPCGGHDAAAQQWSGLSRVRNTTAVIGSAMMVNKGMPACLATDGGSLFVQECLHDPPSCSVRAPNCPVSVRVGQLWYYRRKQQLVSSFTDHFYTSKCWIGEL